jgi:hypothetical protein
MLASKVLTLHHCIIVMHCTLYFYVATRTHLHLQQADQHSHNYQAAF